MKFPTRVWLEDWEESVHIVMAIVGLLPQKIMIMLSYGLGRLMSCLDLQGVLSTCWLLSFPQHNFPATTKAQLHHPASKIRGARSDLSGIFLSHGRTAFHKYLRIAYWHEHAC